MRRVSHVKRFGAPCDSEHLANLIESRQLWQGKRTLTRSRWAGRADGRVDSRAAPPGGKGCQPRSVARYSGAWRLPDGEGSRASLKPSCGHLLKIGQPKTSQAAHLHLRKPSLTEPFANSCRGDGQQLCGLVNSNKLRFSGPCHPRSVQTLASRAGKSQDASASQPTGEAESREWRQSRRDISPAYEAAREGR